MFEIFTDGRSFNDAGAACTVIIKKGKFPEWRRGMMLGNITSNQAELKAILYGLLSIHESWRQNPVIIRTRSKYAALMFSWIHDDWEKPINEVENNKELIQEIRDHLLTFKKWEISLSEETPPFRIVYKLTEDMVKSGKEFFIKK